MTGQSSGVGYRNAIRTLMGGNWTPVGDRRVTDDDHLSTPVEGMCIDAWQQRRRMYVPRSWVTDEQDRENHQ